MISFWLIFLIFEQTFFLLLVFYFYFFFNKEVDQHLPAASGF